MKYFFLMHWTLAKKKASSLTVDLYLPSFVHIQSFSLTFSSVADHRRCPPYPSAPNSRGSQRSSLQASPNPFHYPRPQLHQAFHGNIQEMCVLLAHEGGSLILDFHLFFLFSKSILQSHPQVSSRPPALPCPAPSPVDLIDLHSKLAL